MNTNLKIKLTDSNSLFKSVFFSRKIVDPKRDWKILMVLFLVFILSAVGFDYYMNQQIVSGDMYVSLTRADLTIQSLKSTDLKNILNNFEKKKITSGILRVENLVDPSL